MNALGSTGVEGLPRLGDPELTAALLMEGAHFEGHLALSQGAIISGLIWGAIVVGIIDGKFRNAGGFAVAASVMSSLGIIHGASLQIPQFDGITIGYLITGAFLILYPKLLSEEDLSERVITPDDPGILDTEPASSGRA